MYFFPIYIHNLNVNSVYPWDISRTQTFLFFLRHQPNLPSDLPLVFGRKSLENETYNYIKYSLSFLSENNYTIGMKLQNETAYQ